MRHRLYILHLKLRGFVQRYQLAGYVVSGHERMLSDALLCTFRREHSVLAALLPSKEEYVMTVRISGMPTAPYQAVGECSF